MTSIIKVDNLQNQCGANIISESSNVITIGASGDTVTLAAGASQSGFGRSGSVNWDTTAKTTGFTAVSGNGYFCNTTSAAFTVTLPLSPSAGAIVAIADYNGTAATNNITVGRNSSNINGAASNFTISKNYAAISFVYVDVTAGWRSVDTSDASSVINPYLVATGGTESTCGDYKIHTFTGPGTFTVTQAASSPTNNEVSYLVVGGGAGSGGNAYHIAGGGGGGAGGYRESKAANDTYTASPLNGATPITVTATAYPITVGAGGAAGKAGPGVPVSGPGPEAAPGANSVFSTITATGGGKGGQPSGAPSNQTGDPGGSGGGGGGGPVSRAGGSGNSPPTSPAQGSNGGPGSTSNQTLGGSGGGATGAGSTSPGCSPTPSTPSRGAGATTSISGSPTLYSRGGSYSSYAPGVADPSSAGASNSGNGADATNAGPAPANPNSVAANYDGKAGGSGIVVIRYKYQ